MTRLESVVPAHTLGSLSVNSFIKSLVQKMDRLLIPKRRNTGMTRLGQASPPT